MWSTDRLHAAKQRAPGATHGAIDPGEAPQTAFSFKKVPLPDT